jgi:hypothetical protein
MRMAKEKPDTDQAIMALQYRKGEVTSDETRSSSSNSWYLRGDPPMWSPRPFVTGPRKSVKAVRADFAARLRARAPEIEKAILARIRGLSEPVRGEDSAFIAGLQNAVAEVLSYGLEGIEKGSEPSVPIPPETARQARRAAREGIGLDTVLRRYAAGNKTLEEFIVAEADGISSQVLNQVLSEQGPQVDRLMKSVSAEYQDELDQTRRSPPQKQTARILRLLESNSLVSPTDLEYNFDNWHVGMIFLGPDAEESARALTKSPGYRSLSAVRDEEITWVWFGSPRKPFTANLELALIENAPKEISVAIGEPREGLNGWRQTHHEAQIALQVMLYQPQPITRCRDVILDSAVIRDQWLAMSLIETYLAPLDGRGNSGVVLRKTLRAYFKADRNIASASLALGVARHTVERHLHRIEEHLDQNLNTCNAQLQVALRAEELVASTGRTQQLSSA